jgi:hypothetical protein
MRPESDIDPRRLTVEPGKRRRRRDRKKPAPSKSAVSARAETVARVEALPASPGVMQEARGEGWVTASPHADTDLWELQLADAFGTRSISLIRTFTAQLRALSPEDWDEDARRWKASETEWNALLALVADHRPANAAQAALAAQMGAIHLMTMRMSAQALNNGYMVLEKDATIAGKLARTYAMQCETMAMLKGKERTAKQSIAVTRESHHHQHIHVHRGGEKNDDQSHATDGGRPCPDAAVEPSRGTALPGSDSSGEVVPIASRKW